MRRGQCGAEPLAELLHAPPLGVELVDALLELARHVVEDGAELRELVAPRTGRRWSNRPGGDGADAVGERAQRVRERADGERRTGADQHQEQAHEQRDALADRARVGVELVLRVESDRIGVDARRSPIPRRPRGTASAAASSRTA